MKSWFHAFRRHTAFFIAKAYPTEKWYQVAYQLSRWMVVSRSTATNTITDSAAFNRAWKLNSLLAFLTRTGRPFPIPVTVSGMDVFKKERPSGMILCSTHLPLVKVAMQHLAQQHCKPDAAIAADVSSNVEAIALWGITDTIPVIKTGANVLLKTKSLLQKGCTVAALVDAKLGAGISLNLFHLAHKAGADVVLFFAELERDGTVKIDFIEVSAREENSSDVVNRQAAVLERYTNAILERYKYPDQAAIAFRPGFQL